MSPSLRFLGLVLIGWGGARAASLGLLPGAALFRVDMSEAKPAIPPITPTEFPPIDPPPGYASFAPQPPPGATPAFVATSAPIAPQFVRLVVRPTVSMPAGAVASGPGLQGAEGAAFYSLPARRSPFEPAALNSQDAPASQIAANAFSPLRHSIIATPAQSLPLGAALPSIDRLQLTAWALLRSNGLQSGPAGIAPGGALGASQAGSRLTYNVTRQIAVAMRATTTVGRRGGEVAAGVRYQPLPGLPVWLTLERRQRIGRYSDGRSAFALFFEGGVYNRPLPAGFSLDAYAQGGVVGFRHRDLFVDGAMTATRPVFRNLWGGVGFWGAAQPGLYRVEAGPRLTYRVRPTIKVHLDYRQRLAGNALPGSGPVVTLAADF